MACGATHAMEVWTIWYPTYWVAGAIKLMTAIASVTTAILLVHLIPQLLALPSPTMLRLEIAERVRAEEALSRANGRLIEAHEEERTRIARELHDDINQRVGLLAMSLDRMSEHVPASATSLKNAIGEVHKAVSGLGSDIQSLSHRLHSSKLQYLGLTAAAEEFCRELSDQHGVVIDYVSKGISKDLLPEIALCLYRVLQEALQNAMKHSGARRFEVSLIGIADEIRLTVRDSGTGFDPEQVAQKRGLGITSMKERLKLVGGKLSIESRPGFGTGIHAHVKFPHEISAH
jgi:signal transduction histidine kinase